MTGRAVGAARPLINRYKPMRAALIAYAISEVGLAITNVGEFYVLTQLAIDPYLEDGMMGAAFGLGIIVIGPLQVLALIASFILVSLWTFRAMKNLHLSGAREASMSPGWAVGWYFIPFANLWKPYEGMLQIWRGSMSLAGQPAQVAGFVGWWWATWIVSNILSNISVQMTGFIEEGPAYDAGLLVAVAASLVAALCTVFLLQTTKAITQAQEMAGSASVTEVFA